MSNTDSFIEEVTEEVRRDRLYRLMRKYGWIAVLAVLILVGGAAYNEWRKAQDRQITEALGDSILAALEADDAVSRAKRLSEISAPTPASQAVVDMMAAGEATLDTPEEAAARLLGIADQPDIELIYRQVATLKAVMIPNSGISAQDRRDRLDGLALGSGVIRLMAEEQLAYLDVSEGNIDAAIARLQQVSADAEATPGLRRRATQVIVALGGDLEAPQLGQ